ncbi:phosphohydrolase, putative [Plasmodium chabaudi adami]|uniref:Phosphohydrolase, putative n=1 Tax=Plasmodium chabaudi adami TaxID=5826 RepID=A0A1C6YQG8_PLACE|nr:phosphohydrolase, putative [Plasmodium chabaudi adami]
MNCNINHINETQNLKKLFQNVSLDREDIILQTFERKNIQTIYDLAKNFSFFKFTTSVNTCNDDNDDSIEKIINENGDYYNIHGVSYNINLSPNCENNNENLNGTTSKKIAHINDAHKSENNGCVNPNWTHTNGNLNGILSNNVHNKHVENDHNKRRCIDKSYTNIEAKEMHNYYEKMKKEQSALKNNTDLVYFDIHINIDAIKLIQAPDRDKVKLINVIYEIIKTNDILMMCMYLNLINLWPRFESCNIRDFKMLKSLIIDEKNFEYIKSEIGISFCEFIIILNFILKVKKKRIFCKNIFNQYNQYNYTNSINNKTKKETKTICDKIHQFIEYDNWIFQNIIDNPFFQRLRNLSQLGTCQFVYPGATHTRFEHSLGVGYLSGKYFTHLCNRSNLSPYYGELNRMFRCVQIAALCHDLGHGPFSHTFESFFMNYKKKETECKWNHAYMSLKIAEHIIENLIDKDDVLDVSDIKIIKKLIIGRNHNKPFCGIDPIDSLIEASFDIICNNTNGLDADRFDYLQRDATIAPPNGTLPSLNCNRIIGESAVINGQITYNIKEIHPVWTVYTNRYSLFKQVYTHRKVRAMELMLCDGFRLANNIFKWSESLHDLDSFIELTDFSIINDIKKKGKKKPNDQIIKDSLNIINAVIQDRNSDYAYKYISEINVSEPTLINHLKGIANEDRISRYAHGLSPDDIIIDWNYLNYGMKANDPLDYVYFYSSDNEDHAFIAHKEYRGTSPKYFEECNVRLYCKNKKVAHLAKEAHLKFLSNDVFPHSSPELKGKV